MKSITFYKKASKHPDFVYNAQYDIYTFPLTGFSAGKGENDCNYERFMALVLRADTLTYDHYGFSLKFINFIKPNWNGT